MFSMEIESDPDDRDLLIAELWEQGSAGIVELDPQRLRAFFEDGADRNSLARLFPGADFHQVEEHDWVQTARDLLQPVEVGRCFFLVPAWRDDPAPPGRFRIAVNPGLAFGTGVHPTTQLCIEALEDYRKPGMAVLDVGTGSGILAEVARLLGSGAVYGCDVDGVAVAIAGGAFVGSVNAVAADSIDLVVANISPTAIVQLAPDFTRVLRPGGVILASGFEGHEVAEVRKALPPAREVRHKNGWALIVAP
ncbi:MAG TPA: 50S ribosomal protein L11 methyltransferase [Bryobacteraceae bacterium]|nr:50S ribosomal protein L11 methyltransferase [Bryobacteraceae bacterium]